MLFGVFDREVKQQPTQRHEARVHAEDRLLVSLQQQTISERRRKRRKKKNRRKQLATDKTWSLPSEGRNRQIPQTQRLQHLKGQGHDEQMSPSTKIHKEKSETGKADSDLLCVIPSSTDLLIARNIIWRSFFPSIGPSLFYKKGLTLKSSMPL